MEEREISPPFQPALYTCHFVPHLTCNHKVAPHSGAAQRPQLLDGVSDPLYL